MNLKDVIGYLYSINPEKWDLSNIDEKIDENGVLMIRLRIPTKVKNVENIEKWL